MNYISNLYSNIHIQEFLTWEQATNDTIDVKKVYIDIADDLVAGILLSQLVFWYLPNKYGNTKLRVIKQGELWIAKSREEWHEEIRITPKQFDLACKKLEEKGLIKKAIFKFAKKPTVHLSLNFEKLISLVNQKIQEDTEKNVKQAETLVIDQRVKTQKPHEDSFLPKGEKPGSLPLVNNLVFDQRVNSITEITNTEINYQETTTTPAEGTPSPLGNPPPPKTDVVVDEKDLIELQEKIKRTIGAPFHIAAMKELLKKKGLDKVQQYLKNFSTLVSGQSLENVAGYFYRAVMDEYIIPQKSSFSRQWTKPAQMLNYEQRTYDDAFFESLYANA